MRKKSRILFLFILVLLMTAANVLAEMVFQKFDSDPTLSDPNWTNSTTDHNGTGTNPDPDSYYTWDPNGYLVARGTRSPTDRERYVKQLSQAYEPNKISNLYIEYDTVGAGGGTWQELLVGLFGDGQNNQDFFGDFPVKRDTTAGSNPKMTIASMNAEHKLRVWDETVKSYTVTTPLSDTYAATNYVVDTYPWTTTAFRVKMHFWRTGTVCYGRMDVYQIAYPNTESGTVITTGDVQLTADSNVFGSFKYLGIGNPYANAQSGTSLSQTNLIDNLYFSTDGPNPSTAAPSFFSPVVIDKEVAPTTTTTLNPTTTLISSATATAATTVTVKYTVRNGADGSGAVIGTKTTGTLTVPYPTGSVDASASFGPGDFTPTVWSPSDPCCYQLTTEVRKSTDPNTILVAKKSIIGFRKFEVVGQNFKLNGNPVYLFGLHRTPPGRILANIYNDQSFIDQHIARLKAANVNMVRIADVNAAAWFEACDKAGIMVFCGPYDTNNVLSENEARLQEYVNIVNTHPCVVAWVTGNEWSSSSGTDRTNLYNYIRSLDTSRLVFLADSAGFYTSGDPATSTGSNFLDHHDYSGWYYGSAFDFTGFAASNASKSCPVTLTECVGAYTDYATTGGGFTLGQDTDTTHLDKYIGAIERVIGHSYNYVQDSLAYQTSLAKEVAETLRRSRSTTSAISGATLFTEAYFYDMDQYYYHNEPSKTESAKPVIAAITSAYEPVHVSIECVNPNVFAGTSISATMHILNDKPAGTSLGATNLKVKLLDSANAVKSDVNYPISSIAYYATRTQAVSIPTTGLTTGNYTIVAEVNETAPILSRNTMPVFVAADSFKKCVNTGGTGVLAVYDPCGTTLTALTAAGVNYKQITSFATFPTDANTHLIIGKGSFDATVKAAEANIKTWLNAGKRMLILEQNSAGRTAFGTSWLGKSISLGGSSEEFTNIERPQLATLMNGLDRMNDFRNWNDAGTGARSVYESYVGIYALDPNVAVLANGGQHVDDATLVEVWPDGGGSCIISTLNAVTKVSDPKAARCLANIVGYLLESATHYQYVDVGYKITFGNFATEKGLFSIPLLQGMIVADSGAAHYQPDGRAFRGPQTISDTVGNLTAADNNTSFICPLYIRANFNIGGAVPITMDVSNPNDVAPSLSYRLKVNGVSTGYVSLVANERKTSTFNVASITAGTNVKLEIESDKGLVFHSMRLGNAIQGDINEDTIVNFIDYAMLAENWLKDDFWSPQ